MELCCISIISTVCLVFILVSHSTLLSHSLPTLLLFTPCNHTGTGVTVVLCLLMQSSEGTITLAALRYFIFASLFLIALTSARLSPAFPSLSVYINWLFFLSLPPPSSFLILFISHSDAPRRHSAKLSDLNKCLRLERGLSCGLGRRCGSQCSSNSIVRDVEMSLCQIAPPSSPPSVTLSLCHLFLISWEMYGKPQLLSMSRKTR